MAGINTTRARHLERDLRIAGLVLLMISPWVRALRLRVLHWRRLWSEQEGALALQLQAPGALLADAGVQLLQLSSAMKPAETERAASSGTRAEGSRRSRAGATTQHG